MKYLRADGSEVDPKEFNERLALLSGTLLQDILTQEGRFAVAKHIPPSWLDAVRYDKEVVRLLWLAVALLLLHDVCVPQNKALSWPGGCVVASGLKLGTKTTKDPVIHYHNATQLLSRPDPSRFPRTDEPLFSQTSSVGLLLRNPNISNPRLGVSLPPVLLYALLCDLLPHWHGDKLDEDAAASIVQQYAAFWELVESRNLLEAPLMRPILDGNEIADTLQCHRALISRIQPFVLAWQFDHPGSTDAPACAAWLQSQWAAGQIVPESERSLGEKKKRQKQ